MGEAASRTNESLTIAFIPSRRNRCRCSSAASPAAGEPRRAAHTGEAARSEGKNWAVAAAITFLLHQEYPCNMIFL